MSSTIFITSVYQYLVHYNCNKLLLMKWNNVHYICIILLVITWLWAPPCPLDWRGSWKSSRANNPGFNFLSPFFKKRWTSSFRYITNVVLYHLSYPRLKVREQDSNLRCFCCSSHWAIGLIRTGVEPMTHRLMVDISHFNKSIQIVTTSVLSCFFET